MTRTVFALVVLPVLAGSAPVAPGNQQAPERDVFAFVRAMDEAGARQAWPGFSPSEWPVALFDGTRTILLRHPSPPSEFTLLPGRPGVFTMSGRHPAVAGNSTREIAGVRTATVIATPNQALEATVLAYVEEVFHVFWMRRHVNFRPNEMTRYAYPVKDELNLQRILAEDEALARALDAGSLTRSLAWGAAALRIRRERTGGRTEDERAYEAGLEMMEGTASYVARVAAGLKSEATSARLRSVREADGIRSRFYDSGAAMCLLLDRFEPGWKARIDSDLERTTADLLDAAVTRSHAPPAEFSAVEWSSFQLRAAVDITTLSARQRQLREVLIRRGGPRVTIEVPSGAQPLRVTRFDPIHLLVLEAAEVAHANYLTLEGPDGTIELTNPGFARGSFAGTVSLTSPAGRHPLTDGIRMVTVVGLKGTPTVARHDGIVTIRADGVRATLGGADVRTDGDTIRVTLARPR